LIEFIIGAFLYAKLKNKYKLSLIFKSWHIYPPLLFAIFYIFLEITIWNNIYWFIPYAYYIKTATLLSYIPLILKYNLNEDKNGSLIKSPMVIATFCLWLGATLNKIAVKANGGMPVFPDLSYWTGYVKPEFIQDGIHVLGNAYCKMIYLCDIFDFGWTIVSVGDLMIRMYVFIILYYAIKNSNKNIK